MIKKHAKANTLTELFPLAVENGGWFLYDGSGRWEWFSMNWTPSEIFKNINGEYKIVPWASILPETTEYAGAGTKMKSEE